MNARASELEHSRYHWIVVGGGLCGSALAYELAREQVQVLLIEPHWNTPGATKYSYGGIAHWAGTCEITRTLCQVARQRYPELSEELKFDCQYRERSLLLTIDKGLDPQEIAARYEQFMVPPTVLDATEAREREPLLNPAALAGALQFPHAHVSPMALVMAYRQAFQRQGGQVLVAEVESLEWPTLGRTSGVRVQNRLLEGERVVIGAGAWSRRLLEQQGIQVPLYFTHAELIETAPADFEMQTMVMPAIQQRFSLEAQATEQVEYWDESQPLQSQQQPLPVLDAGLVQFSDRHCCLGQISRVQTQLDWQPDAVESEQQMRAAIAPILPVAATLPGNWHSTRVSFCSDGLPLVGRIPQWENLFLFSGFSSPFVYVPPLAQWFAQAHCSSLPQSQKRILQAVSPSRFTPRAA